MSIEDIDYLKENSEKDSCIMYIDSALRDRDKFAKPNQYVIPLDEPFRYVYGVDVLDASIPSSMFNIDINNNNVRTGVYKVNVVPNYETGNGIFLGLDGQLKEPDPDLPTTNEFQLLFNELGGVDGFDDILTNTEYIQNGQPFTYKTIFTTRRILTAAYYRRNFIPAPLPEEDALLTFAKIQDMFYSPSANGSKYLLVVRECLPTEQSVIILNANELNRDLLDWSLETSYEYPLGVFNSLSRSKINDCRILVFANSKLDRQPNIVYVQSLLTDVPELPTTSRQRYSMYFEFTKNDKSYYIQYKSNWDASFLLTANARDFIETIHRHSAFPDVKLVEKLLRGPADSLSVQPPNGRDILNYSFQIYRVYCVALDSFDVDDVSKNGYERIVANNAIYLEVGFQLLTLQPGNYGVTNFLTEIKRAFLGSGINIENGYTDDILIRPNLRFSSATPFFFDMDRSTLRTVMGFDELAYENNDGYYKKVYYRDNNRLFGCLPVPVLPSSAALYNNADTVFKIISPGVVFLLGTRYCILRCEELDDHMYGSRAYGRFSPGIALFKMFNVNDVAHQRLDFVNLKKKPFHPIGKLDKMTFRFETSNGSLYDFKGANHLLVISIKYYVPSQKRTFTQSVLNPNYKSDFASYFLGRSVAYKDNSDEEEEDELPNEENDKNSNSFVNRFVKKEISYCAEDDSDNATEGPDSVTVSSEFDFT